MRLAGLLVSTGFSLDAYILYNVYGSNVYPVDVRTPDNLLATGIRDTEWELKGRALSMRYYAVTAIDRYGNESAAIQESQKTSVNSERKPLTPITQRRNPWRK